MGRVITRERVQQEGRLGRLLMCGGWWVVGESAVQLRLRLTLSVALSDALAYVSCFGASEVAFFQTFLICLPCIAHTHYHTHYHHRNHHLHFSALQFHLLHIILSPIYTHFFISYLIWIGFLILCGILYITLIVFNSMWLPVLSYSHLILLLNLDIIAENLLSKEANMHETLAHTRKRFIA